MYDRLRLGAMLFLIAACQSETTTTTNTPPPAAATAERDVCGMISMEELKTAAGLDEATGQSSKSGGADVCTWTGASGKAVVVQVFPSAANYDTARAAFESLYQATAEEVTGIGEKAYYIAGNTGAMPTGTLVVAKGSTPISVQVMGGTGDAATRKGEATAIAHVVHSKV
jgi:hypothetical protein